jgi:fumarate hydratase subunit beta
MGEIINIRTPLDKDMARQLKAGDQVSISGTIYAARDAAHKRMAEMLKNGGELPVDLKDQIIYYVGPCPARPGEVLGSAGPTTSGRMDAYAPALIEIHSSSQLLDVVIHLKVFYKASQTSWNTSVKAGAAASGMPLR